MLTVPERLLALRYLRSRRRTRGFSAVTWLSLISIGLGVAVLIYLISIMNGMQTSLIDRILGVTPQILVGLNSPSADAVSEMRQRIAAVPGVLQVAPQVTRDGLAVAGKARTGVRIIGIEPADLTARPAIADEIVEGRLADFSGPSVVIGAGIARSLALPVGGRVKLIVPRRDPDTGSLAPRGQSFTVAAVFETGRQEYDELLLYLALPAAQQLFDTGDVVPNLDVVLERPLDVDEIGPKVRQAAGGDASLKTWRDLNSALVGALQVERVVTSIILILVIVVAVFGIMAGQVMMVKDKAREIAILRTIGTTRGAVLRVFMFGGLVVGFVGAAIGCLFGVLAAQYLQPAFQAIYRAFQGGPFDGMLWFLAHLPSLLQPSQIAFVVAIALVLTLAASVYPAWRAARLDPVEALRYE